MRKPLAGIRVLDLGRYVAGPYCGMLLADFGAEVIKVEDVQGEEGRIVSPLYGNVGLAFLAYNRNKKSVTLDLKKPEEVRIFLELVKTSDIVLENFRPGTMEKMGIGYDVLKAHKQDIILVSLTGYGKKGPYAQRPAFDQIAQASGGLMSVTGFPDGPPTKIGPYAIDIMAGMHAFAGALLALRHRDLTGLGQWVDVSLMDVVVSMLECYPAEYLLLGVEPGRDGNRRKWSSPCNLYKAADGYVYIIAAADVMWPKFCQVIGRPDLIDDPRTRTRKDRAANNDLVDRIIQEWIEGKPAAEVVKVLSEVRIPAARVQTVADICVDPQVAEREMIIEIPESEYGRLILPGTPIKMSEVKVEVTSLPPKVGQHNEEILGAISFNLQA